MKVLPTEKGLIKTWAPPNEVEPQAVAQLKNIAAMPFIFKHVAAMADVHLGKGATVGSVIASKNAIMPAAVGVDIGCGMVAVKTMYPVEMVREQSKKIFRMIQRIIPVGFESHKKISDMVGSWSGWKAYEENGLEKIANQKNVGCQIGTLGGGNHFIEICEDQDGCVWVMLHSGSRNIGKRVAEYHINEAKQLMDNYLISLEDKDLAYFTIHMPEFQRYIRDLTWCQEYAKFNRHMMLQSVMSIFSRLFPDYPYLLDGVIDCHHNYASLENHFNENVWVTRKGAVRAREGDLGIVPGSMGTRSYIVKGLGNAQSFHSCSHGAGRRMSRSQARKEFTKADLEKQLEGVMARTDEGVLDEIPSAYKDIDQVMENQKDLVEVVATLKQFICVKG